MNAANENLPAPKINGVEVSSINDITGKEEPQKNIVEKIAKIGAVVFIYMALHWFSNVSEEIIYQKHYILLTDF